MPAKELLNFKNLLLAEMSQGSGIKGLVTKISSLLCKPVLITTSSSRVIASSSPERVSEKDFFSLKDKNQLIYPLQGKGSSLGYLVILDVESHDQDLKQFGQEAVNICVLEMLQQQRLMSSERQYKEAFLYDLIYGNIESKEDILSRAKIWNWDFERPQRVIVFELEDFDQHMDSQKAAILTEIISEEMVSLGVPSILIRKRGEVTVILPSEQQKRHQQRIYKDMFVKKIVQRVEKMLYPKTVKIGAGRIYTDPSEIFRSYQEAKVALVLGAIMDIKDTTPSFEDLGLTRILYNHDHQELIEFYRESLEELERYDREQNSDLINTLEKYLIHRCDLKEAADALFLHPNTLRYRLKKIEEVLDVDLNDFDTKLNLKVAFKIVYLLKASGTEVKDAVPRV